VGELPSECSKSNPTPAPTHDVLHSPILSDATPVSPSSTRNALTSDRTDSAERSLSPEEKRNLPRVGESPSIASVTARSRRMSKLSEGQVGGGEPGPSAQRADKIEEDWEEKFDEMPPELMEEGTEEGEQGGASETEARLAEIGGMVKQDLQARSRPASPEILLELGKEVKADLQARSRPSSPMEGPVRLGTLAEGGAVEPTTPIATPNQVAAALRSLSPMMQRRAGNVGSRSPSPEHFRPASEGVGYEQEGAIWEQMGAKAHLAVLEKWKAEGGGEGQPPQFRPASTKIGFVDEKEVWSKMAEGGHSAAAVN